MKAGLRSQLKSARARNSVCSFRSPIARAEPIPVDQHSAAPAGSESTILIVEDDEAVRSLVREVLDHSGYRVFEAEHGEAALEIWK